MTTFYDPVAEARTTGLFHESQPKGVMELAGKGTEVGWYLKPDGRAARLPATLDSRDRYEKKKFRFMREWGIYSRTAVRVGGQSGYDIKPESEWEQLARLAREHPDDKQRALITKALGTTFAASQVRQVQVLTCACGLEYTAKPAYDNHQLGCARAALVEIEVEKAANAAGAPVEAKPPVAIMCRKCGAGPFENTGFLGAHARQLHPKAGGVRLKAKRAAARAAQEEESHAG